MITPAQIEAVKKLLETRCADVQVGKGNLVTYVAGAFPEVGREVVAEAAFSGPVSCKVYRWDRTDLAVLMMKLRYFASQPA